MKNWANLAISAVVVLLPTLSFAGQTETQGILELAYSDGRPVTTGVDNVNAVLRTV